MDYVFSGLSENFNFFIRLRKFVADTNKFYQFFFKFFENYMRDKVVKKSCFV